MTQFQAWNDCHILVYIFLLKYFSLTIQNKINQLLMQVYTMGQPWPKLGGGGGVSPLK